MSETILVTGATGHTGGYAVRQLHAHGGVTIKALSKNPEEANFPDGVQAVRGDLTDPDSLDEALAGVDKIFLIWPTMFAERADERARDKVIPKLAAQARRIVYLSSAGVEEYDDPDNDSHANLERLIRQHAKEWTFLRSGGHMSNDLGQMPPADGVLRGPFLSWARSQVHPADLAAVGVRALLTDELVDTATAYLSGEELLTGAERLQIVGDLVGRPVTTIEEIPLEQAREFFLSWVPPEDVDDVIATMKELAARPEPVTHAVRDLLGRPASSHRQWALDHLRAFIEPTVEGVALAYLSLIRQGKFDAIAQSIFAEDFVRNAADEMDGPPIELTGEEVRRNMERAMAVEEIHDVRIDGPLLAEDRFGVRFTFDATDLRTGERGSYAKVSIYAVRDGWITREDVFFDRPPSARSSVASSLREETPNLG